MKLSLTLPSLFEGPAHRVIENVRATVRGIDHEIVVVSPFEVSGPDIKWIREEERRGPGTAHATAARHVTGDVVFPLVDDITLLPGWAQDGLTTLTRHERGRSYAVGIGQVNRIVGTVFGIYYPFFPMVRRSVAEQVGGFYNPALKHHFTDSDFAFRVWSAGGACGWTGADYIERIRLDEAGAADLAARRAASLGADMATFLDRWRPRYGQGWRADALSDFNLDIDPVFRAFLPTENTIYLNHPSFQAAHRHYVQMMANLYQAQAAG